MPSTFRCKWPPLLLTLAALPKLLRPLFTAAPVQGMLDAQLDRLLRVLRHKRIWALNVGENFATSQEVSWGGQQQAGGGAGGQHH